MSLDAQNFNASKGQISRTKRTRGISNEYSVFDVDDLSPDFKFAPTGLASSRLDGEFAPPMPFASMLYETHLYAEDFLRCTRYLFGVQTSPCFLKCIQEIQKEMEGLKEGQNKIEEIYRRCMGMLYQELELRELVYYKIKMSQTLYGVS